MDPRRLYSYDQATLVRMKADCDRRIDAYRLDSLSAWLSVVSFFAGAGAVIGTLQHGLQESELLCLGVALLAGYYPFKQSRAFKRDEAERAAIENELFRRERFELNRWPPANLPFA